MKTNKIVGLLLAGSMLMSTLPVFAAGNGSTVSTDKTEYSFGDEVTITTDAYERIIIKDSNNHIVVMGVSEYNDSEGEWQYSFKIPEKSTTGYQQEGYWVDGNTYTIVAGPDNDFATSTFKLQKEQNDSLKVNFDAKTATVKSFKKLVSFKANGYEASDDMYIEYSVEKSGKELEAGTDYEVRFDGEKYGDNTEIETTVKKVNSCELYFWFKSTGTYTVYVTLSDANGSIVENSQKITVSNASSGGGGSSGGSSVNLGGSTWIPGITGANTASGIDVRLNPSQQTQYGVSKNVAYSASFLSPTSFTVGVTVDGVPTTNFAGYDPIYIKVPYNSTIADTTTLVVKDSNGNIIPRSLYTNGKTLVNIRNLASSYSIVNNPVSFGDVHHPWATTSINALAAREIINGVGDGLYDPDRAVTRAEFTKMIVTMFDVYDSSATATFADIDNSQWYAPYVATAQKLAITNGYAEDNTFRPNQIISREEMSAMLYRAAEVLSVDIKATLSKTEFSDDASIQEYAKVPVYKMQQAEVLKGVGNNLFDPQGTCTRAQAAVAIYNMFVLSMTK